MQENERHPSIREIKHYATTRPDMDADDILEEAKFHEIIGVSPCNAYVHTTPVYWPPMDPKVRAKLMRAIALDRAELHRRLGYPSSRQDK